MKMSILGLLFSVGVCMAAPGSLDRRQHIDNIVASFVDGRFEELVINLSDNARKLKDIAEGGVGVLSRYVFTKKKLGADLNILMDFIAEIDSKLINMASIAQGNEKDQLLGMSAILKELKSSVSNIKIVINKAVMLDSIKLFGRKLEKLAIHVDTNLFSFQVVRKMLHHPALMKLRAFFKQRLEEPDNAQVIGSMSQMVPDNFKFLLERLSAPDMNVEIPRSSFELVNRETALVSKGK